LVASTPLVIIVTSRPDEAGHERLASTNDARSAGAIGFRGIARDRGRCPRRSPRLRCARARLYDRAGGNPFFLEQMCAALLEQQA